MWRLVVTSDVNVWFNATSLEARTAFYTVGLDRDTNVAYQHHETVRTFTYSFAITELWQAQGLPGVLLPRLAAVLLIVFSGIWPHVKLLCLSLTWLLVKGDDDDHVDENAHVDGNDGDGNDGDENNDDENCEYTQNDTEQQQPPPPPPVQRQDITNQQQQQHHHRRQRSRSTNYYYYYHHHQNHHGQFRRRLLHSLSTLGKWSLADVLVVCIMVGVLNLDWIVHPEQIKNGLVQDLPLLLQLLQHAYTTTDMCTYLLHLDCTDPPSRFASAKCVSCRDFVETVLNHPQTSRATMQSIADGVTQSGTGQVRLQVQGMVGIYTFCAAVVISIVLSLIVDVFEAKASAAAAANEQSSRQQHQQQRRRYAPLHDQDDDGPVWLPENGNHDLLLIVNSPDQPQQQEQQTRAKTTTTRPPLFVDNDNNDDGNDNDGNSASETTQICPGLQHVLWTICSVVTTVLVGLAVFGTTMDRKVMGAIPHVLHEILAIQWDRSFSLYSLGLETGAAKGWDGLLMSTFMLFLVVGPLLRSILMLVAWLTASRSFPSGPRTAPSYLLTLINFLGAFCAWEVIVLAACLVSMLMPSITDTILNVPECKQIDTETGSCLTVALDPQWSHFDKIIAGGILLVVMAQVTVCMLSRRSR